MKSTCSTVLRRTLGVAGFLIGFGLLSAGVASADDGDSPGLLGGVADLLAPVTEPVLAPLTPVVDTAVRTLSPVLEPLQPVTAPLLAPVVNTVRDVPVVPRIAEPLVAQPSAPAEVPPPVAVPETPPVSVVVPEAHAVTTSGVVPVPVAKVPVAKVPQQRQISAPDVAPPIEAPSSPSPDVPLVLPSTTGSVSSNGSTGLALSDLPAGSGIRPGVESLAVVTDHQIHGSWCYYYGRSHPS
jgi:hypothetical protein